MAVVTKGCVTTDEDGWKFEHRGDLNRTGKCWNCIMRRARDNGANGNRCVLFEKVCRGKMSKCPGPILSYPEGFEDRNRKRGE